jgi:hypothetical protein
MSVRIGKEIFVRIEGKEANTSLDRISDNGCGTASIPFLSKLWP